MNYADIIHFYDSAYPLIYSVWGISMGIKIIKRVFRSF